jgi:WD repeat-containing protein 35
VTTSDQNGLIIVWMLHKNMWFEEMINNRNKSVVRDMKWTADGQKICIVYEDGAVIVGSVDGNRLWGKDLDLTLELVEWSPDGRCILFATAQSDVQIFDAMGNFLARLPIYAIDSPGGAHSMSAPSLLMPKIVGLEWFHAFDGVVDASQPTMALAYENGRMQIMRHDMDDQPVLIDCGMTIRQIKWSTNGTVLAVAGYKNVTTQSIVVANAPTEVKETQMIQFYSPMGKHLRTLKVPGTTLSSMTWEGGSLRMALAVDSFIYFANIRPDYTWGYFGNTLIYSFNKPDRTENCVCFWDTKSDERHIKYVKKLMAIRGSVDHCVLATRTDDQSGQYILILCNAIGSPIDSKYIDVEPIFLAMTGQFIIIASQHAVYMWQYKKPAVKGVVAEKKDGIERVFHIDDPPSSAFDPKLKSRRLDTATSDPICAVATSDSTLIISRASGTLIRYSLPHLAMEQKYIVRCRPQALALNCNSTRLSIIDINGTLTFFDLDARPDGSKGTVGVHLKWERKDAWDMIWSDDNPELFACMEKTRMYVFRGLNPEEPVSSNGYLCSFTDLCIKSVLLDDVLKTPDAPLKENVLLFETKSLRDTRDLLATTPIAEAYQFVDDNPHPRLWRLIAEAALEQLNFLMADKAFVRCHDFQGIQFVKRLKLISDKQKQRAEVAIYFKRFDEAESIFLKSDAKDLAIELRSRLGDWFRVVQLLVASGAVGPNADDALLLQAYSHIGDYYAERQRWDKAFAFYAKGKNIGAQAKCAYALEDFASLEKFIHMLPEGSPVLLDIGEKLQSVGLGAEAVHSFLKSGDIKAAVDCCVVLNQWDSAVELAEAHNFPQIDMLLSKYAAHLLEKNKLMQAVELYRKANKLTDAARLLSRLAKDAAAQRVDPLKVKKFYVLAALHVDKFRRKVLDQSSVGMGALASVATTKGTELFYFVSFHLARLMCLTICV